MSALRTGRHGHSSQAEPSRRGDGSVCAGATTGPVGRSGRNLTRAGRNSFLEVTFVSEGGHMRVRVRCCGVWRFLPFCLLGCSGKKTPHASPPPASPATPPASASAPRRRPPRRRRPLGSALPTPITVAPLADAAAEGRLGPGSAPATPGKGKQVVLTFKPDPNHPGQMIPVGQNAPARDSRAEGESAVRP